MKALAVAVAMAVVVVVIKGRFVLGSGSLSFWIYGVLGACSIAWDGKDEGDRTELHEFYHGWVVTWVFGVRNECKLNILSPEP